MKKIALFLALVVCLTACKEKVAFSTDNIKNPATLSGEDHKVSDDMPKITFEKVAHDFGKMIQGESVGYAYKFTNTGNSSLIISSVEASCGCTTTAPPPEPIKPGESSEIKVKFDSKTKQGKVVNYLIVYSNTYPNKTVLTMEADVR